MNQCRKSVHRLSATCTNVLDRFQNSFGCRPTEAATKTRRNGSTARAASSSSLRPMAKPGGKSREKENWPRAAGFDSLCVGETPRKLASRRNRLRHPARPAESVPRGAGVGGGEPRKIVNKPQKRDATSLLVSARYTLYALGRLRDGARLMLLVPVSK